jgi:hypothetical protein
MGVVDAKSFSKQTIQTINAFMSMQMCVERTQPNAVSVQMSLSADAFKKSIAKRQVPHQRFTTLL